MIKPKSLNKRKYDYSQVHLPRTLESTIFDAFMALEVLAVWLLSTWLYVKFDTVPTHFNAAGKADAWGSHGMLLFFALIATVCMAVLAYSAYHPKYVNTPLQLKTVEEHLINARLLRILGIIIGLLFIAIEVKMSGAVIGLSDRAFAMMMLLFVVAIMGVSIGFYAYIHFRFHR